MTYDESNIFAKILRKEIPCNVIAENLNALAFNDIAPAAPMHFLIIPKKSYQNYHDFISTASRQEIIDLNDLMNSLISKHNLHENGYRIITNTGNDGNQEVKHLHFHLLGGKNLGRMIY